MGASDAATYATLEFGNVGYTPVLADAGFAYFPRNTVGGGSNYFFPRSNTRQVVILNIGNNPLLFGTKLVNDLSELPVGDPTTGPEGFPDSTGVTTITPVEGQNCTRIPAGGSFSLELTTFETRGNYFYVRDGSVPGALSSRFDGYFPFTLIWFSITANNLPTKADISFVNSLGRY